MDREPLMGVVLGAHEYLLVDMTTGETFSVNVDRGFAPVGQYHASILHHVGSADVDAARQLARRRT